MSQKPDTPRADLRATQANSPAKTSIQGPGFAARRVSGITPKTPNSRATASVAGSTRSMSTSLSKPRPSPSPLANRNRVISMGPSTLAGYLAPQTKASLKATARGATPTSSPRLPPSAPSPSTTVIPSDPRPNGTPERSPATLLSRSSAISNTSPFQSPKITKSPSAPSPQASNFQNEAIESPNHTPKKESRDVSVAGSMDSSELLSPTVSWLGTHQPPNPFLVATSPQPSNGTHFWEQSSVAGGDIATYANVAAYGDEHMTVDMITDDGEADEELQAALKAVEDIYTQRITVYKRLLEKTQASAASQLLALQAALDAEKSQAAEYQIKAKRLEESLDNAKSRANVDFGQSSFDIVSAMRGDGFGGFDEEAIRSALRAMRQADRMRLLHIVLDSCLPGDVPLMISLLNRYARTSFDILTHLPRTLSAQVLSYLTIPELLTCELANHAWLEMCRDDSLYRILVKQITRHDPVPVKEPSDKIPGGWRLLYQALHNRERNWSWGNPQSISFLKGHTGYCTTLQLKGSRLISGSYDETIRVWDIDNGELLKTLKVKAVSCVDYLEEQEVFAVGFHDIGRVQVFSSLTWSPLQTLQGHLYGIRAVALSPTYLVSAGADKAIVVWEWRTGKKIVRFGQQINMCIGVQIMEEDRIVSVTIDGTVRTFSIRTREMLSQFQLNQLVSDDPLASVHLSTVGVGPNNMLQWFAAKGTQMTCATKTVILHLTWPEAVAPLPISPEGSLLSPSSPTVSLSPPVSRQRTVSGQSVNSKRPGLSISTTTTNSSGVSSTPTKVGTPLSGTPLSAASYLRKSSGYGPRASVSPRSSFGGDVVGSLGGAKPQELPKLEAVLATPDVSCGAVDPRKRRVVTSTRFSSRLGADRRIFVSTYDEYSTTKKDDLSIEVTSPTDDTLTPSTSTSAADDFEVPGIAEIGGVWGALAGESLLSPSDFSGLDAKKLPTAFKGLATPELNPMALALNHEKIVVGCADGTIYVMSFVGHKYPVSAAMARARETLISQDETQE